MSSTFFISLPPPPTKRIGGVGRIPREKHGFLACFGDQLAEGVSKGQKRTTDYTDDTDFMIELLLFHVIGCPE
jgi:hypothetical protein